MGGFFSALTGLFGSASEAGKTKSYDMAQAYGPQAKGYDPNAGQYGGSPTGLQDYNNRLQLAEGGIDARSAPQADYSGANSYATLGLGARGQQGNAIASQGSVADMQLARAQGRVPSIAGMQAAEDQRRLAAQTAQQSQAAMAAQGARAASAQGAAGVALAGQTAANNTANAQGAIGQSAAEASRGISNSAQINAANERLNAENAAAGTYGNVAGAYSGMRSGDLGSENTAAGEAQFNAGLNLQSRNANDARAMGYEQLQGHANDSAMQGRLQHEGTLAGSYNNASGINAGLAQNNANRAGQQSDKMWDSLGGIFDSGVSGAAMVSDTRAKKQAILDEGRRQGATGDVIELDHPTTGEMLDDRYRQNNSADASSGMYRFAPANDPVNLPPPEARTPQGPQSEDDARAQWERLNGSAADARNQVGGMDTRNHFLPQPTANGGAPQLSNTQRAFLALGGQGRAQGGPVQPGMSYLVGEKGPELLHMKGPGNVIPNNVLGAGSGSMLSDERAKEEAYAAGQQAGIKALAPLIPQQPRQMQSFVRDGKPQDAGYSHVGPAQRDMVRRQGDDEYSVTTRQGVTPPANDQQPERMAAGNRSYAQDLQDQGAVAEANRAMVGSPYAYKDGLTPPEQQAGETNFGPMAQNLEKSPVTATAVKTDPRTGLKVVDKDKALKVTMAGLSDLQRQQDEMRATLNAGRAPKKGGK